jgi:zinc transporter ZupT
VSTNKSTKYAPEYPTFRNPFNAAVFTAIYEPIGTTIGSAFSTTNNSTKYAPKHATFRRTLKSTNDSAFDGTNKTADW